MRIQAFIFSSYLSWSFSYYTLPGKSNKDDQRNKVDNQRVYAGKVFIDLLITLLFCAIGSHTSAAFTNAGGNELAAEP
jgi:hypothetical protein